MWYYGDLQLIYTVDRDSTFYSNNPIKITLPATLLSEYQAK